MPLNPGRLCPCHGEAMYRDRSQHYCAIKRRASWRSGSQRFEASAHGRAMQRQRNARRVWIGRDYHGRADSAAAVQQIRAHIRKRRQDFQKEHHVPLS